MPSAKPFEKKYPIIHRFVTAIGWIEIGDHEVVSAFVRAYDQGGTVYEGKDHYPSMDAALKDLEAGIKAYMDEQGLE